MIEIEDRTMSAHHDTTSAVRRMIMHAYDEEHSARLMGVMAMLALPLLNGDRRRAVRVEVAPGCWRVVDAVSLESERLVFSFGVNGHRVEYAFRTSEGVPRWEVDS